MPPKARGPAGRFAKRKKKGKAAFFNPVEFLVKACSKSDAPIKNEITPREAAVWMMVVFFFLGSNFYTKTFENMTTLDSLYFLVVTMTTVGYGDITPTSRPSRTFTIFWAMFGVGVVAVALVEIAAAVVEAQDVVTAKARAAILRAQGDANAKESEVTSLVPLLCFLLRHWNLFSCFFL